MCRPIDVRTELDLLKPNRLLRGFFDLLHALLFFPHLFLCGRACAPLHATGNDSGRFLGGRGSAKKNNPPSGVSGVSHAAARPCFRRISGLIWPVTTCCVMFTCRISSLLGTSYMTS